jgi:hypothetical protein
VKKCKEKHSKTIFFMEVLSTKISSIVTGPMNNQSVTVRDTMSHFFLSSSLVTTRLQFLSVNLFSTWVGLFQNESVFNMKHNNFIYL